MSKFVSNRLRGVRGPRFVDFHAHFIVPEVFDLCHSHSVCSGFGKAPLSTENSVFARMLQPELQAEGMVLKGLDAHVISSSEVIHSRSWAEPVEEERLTRVVNAACLDWVSKFPERFIPSAVLPFGDMRYALAELERMEAAGVRILNLISNYRGNYLGHARYGDLWAAIAEKGMIAYIHPEGVADFWYQDYAMWNSLGQSIEETKVMTSIMYGGVIDRHPGLKIVVAHGGGYMPHYMGRLDRNMTDKPFTAKNLSKKPSEYLRDFHYDSCVYDPRVLELLVERVGADRLVLGGDYPVADVDPVDFLDRCEMTEADRVAILGGTFARLMAPASATFEGGSA